MIVCVTGVPGSGKSAYAVDFIQRNHQKYNKVYANINKLKFRDNIEPLNYKKFHDIISECKNIYDMNIATFGVGADSDIDGAIIAYLLEVGFMVENPEYLKYEVLKKDRENKRGFILWLLNLIYPIKKVQRYLPSLLVLDEAHNQLPAIDSDNGRSASADPVMLWFISYHRHLYIDAIFITQYYQKIHSSYLRDIEFFLDAIESSSTLLGKSGGSFKYSKHMGTPYFKTNEAGKVTVPKRKELFEMYESGDEVRTKSVVLPWVIFSLFALAITGSMFYYVKQTFFTAEPVKSQSIPVSQTPQSVSSMPKVVKPEETLFDKKIISINCIKNQCIYNDITIDKNQLTNLIKETNSKQITNSYLGSNLFSVKVIASSDFINLFQGANNEKDIINFGGISKP